MDISTTELASQSTWYKSSYSGGGGNSCVEIARLSKGVEIRDSKDAAGPALRVQASAWAAFVGFVIR
ncbi:DUF397 domain-containing protein [Streptomyces sp. NPDC003077]|uniref:DUF397 domain-containing protein n=1 Tax=Streptomyces sp. NPDC003077 TaxID=3154443 RepID=UPI0033A8D35A